LVIFIPSALADREKRKSLLAQVNKIDTNLYFKAQYELNKSQKELESRRYWSKDKRYLESLFSEVLVVILLIEKLKIVINILTRVKILFNCYI